MQNKRLGVWAEGSSFDYCLNSLPAFVLVLDSETVLVRPLVREKGMGPAPVILGKQFGPDDKQVKNEYSQSVVFPPLVILVCCGGAVATFIHI